MTGIERLRDWAEDMSWDFGDTGKRWAKKMNDIADQIEREARASGDGERAGLGAVDVSMSAYDLLPADERESIAWVRDHGGLDHVKAEWRSRVPNDLYERRRQRLLGHIAECETALGRRRRKIEELGRTIEFFQLNNSNFRHLLADVAERLGFTRYGDDYEPEDLIDALDRRLMPEGCEWPRYESGEPVPIGGAVADELGCEHVVASVELHEDGAALHWNPAEPEECVWVGHGERARRPDKPEPPDSWERIEEDAGKAACMYFCHSDVKQPPNCGHDVRSCRVDMTEDLVRRCRALAERERGE